jgi:TPR repeat protein
MHGLINTHNSTGNNKNRLAEAGLLWHNNQPFYYELYLEYLMSDTSNLDMDLASGMAAFEAKEFTRAKQFLARFAEEGNVEAQHRMAIMYQNGLGLVKDDKQAFYWMKKAAEQGYAMAQHGLGFMYMHGECVDKDEAEAVKWFTKAAEQGLAGSAMTLGLMYEQGQGVEKDTAKAQEWYKKSETME